MILKPPMVKAANSSAFTAMPSFAQNPETPGPAAYLTDKFLRDEETQRKMADLPNLGRAIQLQR